MTRALLAAVLLLLALLGWQWAAAERSARRAEAAETQRDAYSKALDEMASARAEESRRTKRMQENQDAEFLARKAAQRDAAAARAAADGLREQARLVARASCPASDSAPTPGSAPAGDGPDLLADVLGELAARADRLAVAADSARIAGQLCEHNYDALTVR